METKTNAENSAAKTENKPKTSPKKFHKVNNGEGVKVAYGKSLIMLPERLEKMWSTEGGKKFITHMMFSFLPLGKKEVFAIGNFGEHKKYDELPKVCTLTGFAVSDSSFKMDDVTKKHYADKKMKVNKLVFAIPCVGSTESTKIVSTDALQVLMDWVNSKIEKEVDSEPTFTKIMVAVTKKMEGKDIKPKTKKVSEEGKELKAGNKPHFSKPKPATHTLGDKYDWDAIKNTITKKQ